jgi:hypothetical protein
MARHPAADANSRHPSQVLTLVIGAVYTLVGILGFIVTGLSDFASETDETLLGFEINPLHNLVHLAIGLAGLAMWRQLDSARIYGWLLAAGYGAAFVYGLFAAGNSDINFLSINGATTACTWPARWRAWPSRCGPPAGPPAAASPTAGPDPMGLTGQPAQCGRTTPRARTSPSLHIARRADHRGEG